MKNNYNNNSLKNFLKDIKNKKVSVIRGNFNVIHSGHLRIFQKAKKFSNILIIYLNKNNFNTFIDIEERFKVLQTINSIDYVYKEKINYQNFLKDVKPDFVLKGIEHKQNTNIEEKIINKYNGKIIFSEGQRQIKKNFYEKEKSKNILVGESQKKYLREYCKRHKIEPQKLFYKFKKIPKNITVIGDIILDQYIDCELIGSSKEEPSLVIMPNTNKSFLGGSGIVAKHLKGANAKVSLVSVIGKDKYSKSIKSDLNKKNIKIKFLQSNINPTILKRRYKVNDRSVIRMNNLKRYEISNEFEKILFENFLNVSNKIDYLIFSDFSYGVLSEALVNKIIEYCKKKKIKYSADSQSSSQIGNILKYKNAELITPTEHEARLSLSDNISGIASLSNKIIKKTNCKNLILKLGQEGVVIFSKNKNQIFNDAIPALNTSPIDTSGAGDSLLAYSSLALANKLNIWEASLIGSIAATVQISRRGNKIVTEDEVKSILLNIN